MFFDVLTLLILILVVVLQLLLARFISSNVKKDREFGRLRDDRLNILVKRVQSITEKNARIGQLVVDHQSALNEKLDALSNFIDERNAYVTSQQEQFKALAESDMLSARRDELICLKELKVALERIMSMTTMSRQSPAAIDVLAIESVTDRIAELEVILDK